MQKTLLMLLMASLLSPAAFAKSKKKRDRDTPIDAPDISAKPEQIIGKRASAHAENPGYSQNGSHSRFQEAFNIVAEHADTCKFSRNSMIAVSLGGKPAQEDIYGRAAAVGKVYNFFEDTFNDNIRYAFDEETSTDCTLSKKEAEATGKLRIDEETFKWSPGVVMAVHTIGKALDQIGWSKVKVDGIHFTHVNANGSYIEAYNLDCEYKPIVHKNVFGSRSTKYYYDVKVDLGNHKTNLDIETIKDCVTSNPGN